MELLVVIAVIGIIAAIAIPAMAGIFGTAETNKTKRNAQNIANTFAGAKAVGNTTTFADKAAAVTAITQNGLSGVAGFSGRNFVAKMTSTEATAAEAYLAYDTGTAMLTYTADGGESVSSGGGAPPPDPNPNPWRDTGAVFATQAEADAQKISYDTDHQPNEHRVVASGSNWIVQFRSPTY